MQSKINYTGFKFGWKKIVAKPTIISNNFYAMREWQEEAFDLLKSVDHMILNAPMGSGKSWLICLLSAYKMKLNDKIRCIIAVPQTIIANGFTEANLLMPDGEKLHWIAQHDLCFEQPSEGTIAYVIKWLKGPYGFFGDRVLLCSHATLVAVYKRLKETNQYNLLSNLLLWIDEAHHLKNTSVEGFENAVVSNGIGELVTYAQNQPTIQIGLATASFFRGDRLSLLTELMEKKFFRYNLPYDRYLASMEHLQSFSFDFLLCGPDYTKAIEKIIKSRKGKDIIYIPAVNSRHSTGNKYEESLSIIKKYKKIHGGKIVNSIDGLTSLICKNNEFKICDLVNEDKRSEKKDYISGINNKDDLDAIIALGMFKEGANWIWADRSIIVGPRTSLVDVIQMIGRLFRDADSKKTVEVIQLLPFSLDQQNEEEFKLNLNNYLKAIYASLILENILHPVQIKMKEEKLEKDKTGKVKESEDLLGEMLPDDSKQLSLIEDVSNGLLRIVSESKETIVLWDEYQKIIPIVLKEYGITDHVEEISKQIWGMFARQTLRMEGINVDDIDFNILQQTSPLDCILKYTSGNCDINTFTALRNAINLTRQNIFMSFEDARNIVRTLGLKSKTEWAECSTSRKLPAMIPSLPSRHYESEWQGWNDWLGTVKSQYNKKKRDFLSFEDAKKHIHNLKLKDSREWLNYCKSGKRPQNIPAGPNHVYSDEWQGWADWLGSNQMRQHNHMSFEEAKNFVISLNLKTIKEWNNYCKSNKKPSNIPASPDDVYSEFKSWGDWLGTGRPSYNSFSGEYRKFEEAKCFACNLHLTGQKAWREYSSGKSSKKPNDIPSNPNLVYKEHWQGWGDFLGTGNVSTLKKEFLSFEEVKKEIQKLELKNRTQFQTYWKKNKPHGIPFHPERIYVKYWQGWEDFLRNNKQK